MKDKSAASLAAPSETSIVRLPASNDYLATARSGMRSLPDRQSQPLLIQQWKYLVREDFIELRGPKIADAGWIDDMTADGTTLWIHLISGKGRK